MKKRAGLFIIACILLFSMAMTAYASESVDLNREDGSIEVIMQYNHQRVGGGALTLYHVGEMTMQNNEYGFKLTDAFLGCGESLENIHSTELVTNLALYAKANVEGMTKRIAINGRVKFEGLSVGLYLMVQETAAEGYEAVAPFLVTIPFKEASGDVYDVNASPKVSMIPDESETELPPTDSKLPQTGQLNWPIPLLAGAGMILFVMGWTLRFKGKKAQP